jgi:hydrogenase nickel incorporation protein HypB
MCTKCGCGSESSTGKFKIGVGVASRRHPHPHGDHVHPHLRDDQGDAHRHDDHSHPHLHDDDDDVHSHGGHTHPHLHGDAHLSTQPIIPRSVALDQDLLARNRTRAAANRRRFEAHGIFAINLVSSPGSGKTTLLERTARALQGRVPIRVVEADQQSSRDVERIRTAGVAGIQINTGRGCHLDAEMVAHAVESLDPPDHAVVFIENVGNLVCPAAFDLGEAHKVVILSTTEGDDKPLKYPDVFAVADLMLINKLDLLRYVEFDVGRCIEYARSVNPRIQALLLSAITGEGIDAWLEWVLAGWRRRAGWYETGRGARSEDEARDHRH